MRHVPSVLFLLAAALPACGRPAPGTLRTYAADAPELAMASIDPVSGTWESVPWTGADWLPYGPRAQLQVTHGLGRLPRTVQVYLAFDELGSDPASAAGDLARVIEVTDTTVTVWNDTNGVYFARIVVQ
jgi:hypothetical protein